MKFKIHFLTLAVAAVPLPVLAQSLPPPLTISAPTQIPTLDGSGYHVGRLKDFKLTMTRQYTPDNKLVTPYTLDYFYGNGNKGETQHGSQFFTIDLLDSHNRVIVANVLGQIEVPRYRCWYSGGSPQQAYGTILFNYVNKRIVKMKINVSRVTGTQDPC